MTSGDPLIADDGLVTPPQSTRRDLVVASLAHALHDGYTDLLYVLLPIWQKEYGLTYAALAGMRALYYGTMATAQIPGTRWLGWVGAPLLLVLGTEGWRRRASSSPASRPASSAYASASSFRASAPAPNIRTARRWCPRPMATRCADRSASTISPEMRGKAVFPALTALLLIAMTWRHAALIIAAVGGIAAIAIRLALPRASEFAPIAVKPQSGGPGRRGFSFLFIAGMLDTACRMGFLLFLPFILQGQGARNATVGFALALVFIGGALGKAVCGWLGDRLGMLATVALTEAATTVLIMATLVLPLPGILVILPILGMMLNGTSSVLYGTVPDFSAPGKAAAKFAIFYTGVIGAGALAPIAYGALADVAGRTLATGAAALTATSTIPVACLLAQAMRRKSN